MRENSLLAPKTCSFVEESHHLPNSLIYSNLREHEFLLVFEGEERERERVAKGILEVKLVDAKGLADTDAIGDMDPYVVIQYRNQERKSSVARGQGTNPTWNETLKFLVQYSGAADTQHKLVLRIMDEDTFTNDDFVGQATINVADVISLGLEKGKGEMHPCKHRLVLPDQTYCGEIRVGVTFIPKVEEEGEDFGGWRHSFHS